MESIYVPPGDPSEEALNKLAQRSEEARKRMKSPDSELQLPIFFEFAGSPKSGKTAIIGIIAHFLKRMGFEILSPTEGASLRTPPALRDDWLAFNAWSGCYALQQILVDCSSDPPPDIVILDRGLFDLAAWMEFLTTSSVRRIGPEDRDRITLFFTLDLWCRREQAVFLFTADHDTSLYREYDSKLTRCGGSVMNPNTLEALNLAYDTTSKRLKNEFPRVFHIDTSRVAGQSPGFQQVAYVVAERIVSLIEDLTNRMLLVTEPVSFNGFVVDEKTVQDTITQILSDDKPRFLDRPTAEATLSVQQVVPYAVLKNHEGKYFCARRRSDVSRKELQGKYTLLVGGHAEQKDWDASRSRQVFEECLKREVEEELVGISMVRITSLGFISDIRNRMGQHHLAFIHEVTVGGRTLIRRQTLDQEFGRETVEWKTPHEIKQMMRDLDPWSQLVAGHLFGAVVPELGTEPTLFTCTQTTRNAEPRKGAEST